MDALKKMTLALSLVIALSGCQQLKPLSKVASNFDKVSIGTSKEAVIVILGEPDAIKGIKAGPISADLLIYKSFLTNQTYIIFLTADRTFLTTQF